MSPMEIVNEAAYPAAIWKELDNAGRIKRQIANRWMLGWPGRVKALIQAGQYQAELDALADNADPTLAEHEKVELAGLSLECPTPTD